MLTLASAILSLTPFIADAPRIADATPLTEGRLPALPFIWDRQRTIERQPNVRLWFRGDNLFRRGDYPDVYFRADEDAYVMIVRVDTDGRLDILSPTHPGDPQLARGGRTYRVDGYSRGSFHVSDDPGMGYVFAVASWEPWDLDRIASSRSGVYRYAGRRIHGDPFIAVQDLADDLSGDRYGYYALDHVAYYVNRRYEYPRYLCYDCHGYRSYAHWDPYAYRCVNFRIVIYTDPYYYPYRYSRGSRVIYVRDPRRPRYEFKGATTVGSTRDPYIDYRVRSDDVDRRRPGSPATDPNLPRRAASANPGATRPGDDVPSRGGVGGRRVLGSDQPSSPGPDGRLPRRIDEESGGDARTPRRGAEPPRSGESRQAEPRRESEREGTSRFDPLPGEGRTPRRADDPRGATEPRREAEPRREPERRQTTEPRREVERRPEPRGNEPRRESEPRREAAPSRESERGQAEPRREPERRPAEARREPERRDAEARRESDRRVEPRRVPERQTQSRPAPKRREAGSSDARSTGGSRPSVSRRKP